MTMTDALVIDTTALDATELAQLRQAITDTLAGFAAADADPAAVYGWTPATATELLKRLAAGNRPVQAQVIGIEVENGGACSRDEVYVAGGYKPDRSLNGFTKPVGRIMRQMQKEELLPLDAVDPMKPIYDPDNPSFQRAQGFRMPPELVPVFAEAVAAVS